MSRESESKYVRTIERYPGVTVISYRIRDHVASHIEFIERENVFLKRQERALLQGLAVAVLWSALATVGWVSLV